MPSMADSNDPERLRLWRVAAIVALGSALGLGWNAASGHGFPLTSNVYIQPGDQQIEAAEAKSLIEKGALALDARPAWAYENAHIPGALPFPEDDKFDEHFAALEPHLRSNLNVIVYCAGFGCEASHILSRKLKQRGIPAIVMNEGWPAWTDAGFPTRSGKQP